MSMSVALSIKEQKSKRNKVLAVIFAGFTIVLLIATIVMFMAFNSKKTALVKSLRKDAVSITEAVHKRVENDFVVLDVLSKLVYDNPALTNLENLNQLLGATDYSSSFDSISYVNNIGNGYEYSFIAKSLAPVDLRSNSCVNKSYNEGKTCFWFDNISQSFYYSVPLKNKKDVPIGVLLAKQTKYILNSYLQYDIPKKKYFVYLLTNNGSFITTDPNTEFNNPTNSVFVWKYDFYTSPKDAAFANSKYGHPTVKWSRGLSLDYNLGITTDIGYGNIKILTVMPHANYKVNSNLNFKIDKKLVLTIFTSIIGLILMIIFVLNLKFKFKKKSDNMVMKWALYDEITDGYNKPKFYLEVSNILLSAKDDDKFAMIVMDINNFKIINQLYDSIKGNSVLKDIADSIKWFIGKDGISARIMSDDFAILYKYRRDEKIIELINNLVRAIGEYKLSVKLLPSFGIYKLTDYNLPIDTMIDRALMAKRLIKDDLDKRYEFFTDELIDKIVENQEIENEMYFALSQKQFVMYLQPKFDTLTGDIVGAETLVRWNHPEKGLLTPHKFIELFEKNGFITYLDQFMIEESCKLLRKWMDNGVTPVPVSINISKVHLKYPRFVSMLKSMIDMYKIPSKLINLEITESAFFDDINSIKKVFSELKEAEFMISMDNFGKNYSSIKFINEFWLDEIKFDKTFINEMLKNERGKTVLKHTNDLVKSLYTKTVAVGIENEEDFNCMKNIEIDTVQGFYKARPMCVIDFENFVFKQTIGNEECSDE